MTESFVERTAGIWLTLVFYAAGGVYMLAFWGIFARAAYHLLLFGVLSILISAALYLLSRWAFWVGLITFPLFFVEFIYALNASVNLAGWDPNAPTATFNVSMIVYLVFLCFSFLLLIDRRSVLKSDRFMDRLRIAPASASTSDKTEKTTEK
jgi:hypothetical protein